MPGGSKYRQWYAMRDRLQREGRWHGRDPVTHAVPQVEDGEPLPKEPRLGSVFERAAEESSPDGSGVGPSSAETVPESAGSTPESLPPLEAPWTAEGKHVVSLGLLYPSLGQAGLPDTQKCIGGLCRPTNRAITPGCTLFAKCPLGHGMQSSKNPWRTLHLRG